MNKVTKPKQAMSSFDIAAFVSELNTILAEGFINKIHQPVHDELVIRVNVLKSKSKAPRSKNDTGREGKYDQKRVLIKAGKFIYVTAPGTSSELAPGAIEVDKTVSAKPFAMLLRKYLTNGKIAGVSQYEFDRLIEIVIHKQQTFKLIIEMFGTGNIILTEYLTDEDKYKIIQPLFPKSWRARELRAGELYEPPPKRVNLLTLNFEDFQNLIKGSNSDLVRTLAININLGGLYAEEVCKLANIDKNISIEKLSSNDVTNIYDQILKLKDNLAENIAPMIISNAQDESELVDIVPINLKVYDEYNKKRFDSFNNAVNEFFSKIKFEAVPGGIPTKQLERQKAELERLERQLYQQQEAVKRFEQETEQFKNIADAIYANYNRCQELLNLLAEWQKEYDWDDIAEKSREFEDIQEINPYDGYLILFLPDPLNEGQKIAMKLDYRKDLNANAANYYEKSKKARDKLSSAKTAIAATEQQLGNAKTRLDKAIEEAPEIARLKRRKTFWFEKYRWFISTDGNIIVAGKDAATNTRVVKKHLKDTDRYAHADLVGAPSVVIKSREEGEPAISELTLEEACRFAVIYSKGWNSKLGAASAYWVKPDQVSKSPQPGEFLPRGAFMIRGKHNFYHKLELEMAVGEAEIDGEQRLMGGPVSAVTARAKKYIVLVPGELKKSTVANALSKIYKIPTDEILRVLPPGNVNIKKTVGIELKL